MLTPRQRDVHEFVDRYIRTHGWGPTLSEIATALNLRSKSNAHYLLNRLQERGIIYRIPLSTRAISVLRPADIGQSSDGKFYRRVPFAGT